MKISIPKLLETSKLLATNAGKELSDLVAYVSTTMSQVIDVLRNGLTFADNFDCFVQTVDLKHGVAQPLNRGSSKAVTAVTIMQVFSTSTCVTGYIWYLDSSNRLMINPQFLNSPADPVKVTLRVEF